MSKETQSLSNAELTVGTLINLFFQFFVLLGSGFLISITIISRCDEGTSCFFVVFASFPNLYYLFAFDALFLY